MCEVHGTISFQLTGWDVCVSVLGTVGRILSCLCRLAMVAGLNILDRREGGGGGGGGIYIIAYI